MTTSAGRVLNNQEVNSDLDFYKNKKYFLQFYEYMIKFNMLGLSLHKVKLFL